jgi:type I restriction enzyme M protein
MNKQQLASKIWESANKMRSKIEANEYKDYILGFIFYKFLSEKEENYLKKNGWRSEDLIQVKEENEDVLKFCQDNLGYFISYDNLFSTWLGLGSSFDVSNVSTALSAFNRRISPTHRKVFSKIFDTLDTGLSKLGDTSGSRTKAISELIHLIKDIPMDGKQDYDVLGFIYEYLISKFAANAGKKAGEFYTPHEVSQLMSEIVANHLRDREEIKIYDPTSGSGSLLINIGKSVAKHMKDSNKIKYYAQELKENTYNLTRMNLVMRDILPDNIVARCGDTLEQDWPYFDESDPSNTYDHLYVDAVVSNPPYSQSWDPTNKDADPRFANFGMAPKTKADYAFLLHDLFHIKSDGIMTIVLPHGVLFRGSFNKEDPQSSQDECKIRYNLIEQNHIDAIIGLPANIFFGTGIPTIIMVLRQKRDRNDILFIDASKGFIKDGKNNKLQASDIKKIADTVINRVNIPKYSRVVSREEIRQNEYNLNIPRYVDSSDKAESWDIYSSIFGGIPNKEIEELNEYWKAFPNIKNQIFKNENEHFSSILTEDVSKTIKNSQDIKEFETNFNNSFTTMKEFLNKELFANIDKLNVPSEEQIISDNIFERLNNIPLIDKYKAYQLLDDAWKKTEIDLEIIQTEGFNACKVVDPNMVVKKKDGKDVEVQDGWIGHIIPFDLVQETFLKDKLDNLKAKQIAMFGITDSYQEIADELTEEDKSTAIFDDEKNAFVSAEVIKEAKRINKTMSKSEILEDSIEEKILKVDELISEEKAVKKEVKALNDELVDLTKQTIENLTNEQAIELLKLKWVVPIIKALNELPNSIVKDLVAKIKNLAEKYETTYLDVEKQISDSEKTLSSLLEELDGNEYDMKGINELKLLLKGGKND